MAEHPIRPEIAALPSYRAGQRAPEGAHKLSSNENPYPPLPSVVAAIAEAAQHVNRYPDPAATALVAAIAARFDVSPDNVALSTGSVALCQHIVSAVAGPGDDVVFGWPSFEAYPIVTGIAGARVVAVPLAEGWRQDMAATAQAVGPHTTCVFVCSPNNPTGTVVSHADVVRLLEVLPSRVVVVIDEAYVEFVDDPEAVRGIELFRADPRVVVLRTFSKAYGLAGLRVGFALAHPTLAEAIRKTTTPFAVSVVAQEAAIASLAAEDELAVRVEQLRAERTQVLDALTEQGWEVPAAQGNFVWLPTGPRTDDVAASLRESGLVVRAFAGAGLRVSVATPDAHTVLTEALRNWAPRVGS